LHCFVENLFKKQSTKSIQNRPSFMKVMVKHILLCFLCPTVYFFGKPINRHFQRYIVSVEMLSTFHARFKYITVKNMPFKATGMKNPPNLPFTLEHLDCTNTPIPRLTPLTTPNGIRIQSAILPQYTFWTERQSDK